MGKWTQTSLQAMRQRLGESPLDLNDPPVTGLTRLKSQRKARGIADDVCGGMVVCVVAEPPV